ncbi:MAG: TldD/PmbA family protein [Rhodospirillales bacterium]|nr:TldD/PmbA family protein [Rhodospirillales bacterium]MCB9996189.1 TldD/PmbA family protein [Rhodospirillales bacterium]
MTDSRKDFEDQARPLARQLMTYAMNKGENYGITDVRIDITASTEQNSSIENGAVNKNVKGKSWGVSITLYAGDRVMSFHQNTLDRNALCAAIDQNMQVIHLVPENPDKRLLESEKVYKGPPEELDLYDAAAPSSETLIDYAKKIEQAALDVPGIMRTDDTGVSFDDSHRLTMATNGLDRVGSSTTFGAMISVVAQSGNRMETSYDYGSARHFSDMPDPAKIGRTASEKALSKLGATQPQTREATIVLSPEAARSFFASVIEAISGTAVYRNSTFLKDKLGQQVTGNSITIEDDPHIKRGFASRTVDGAGMKADKITFIKDGVLQAFNLNLTAARKLGMDPSGREGGLTNIRILPGNQSPETLMADIKDGFYIKSFQGGGADVNNGSFSRPASGVEIKDGKLTNNAVAGFVVAGNLKDMFMNAVVANDTPALPNTKSSMAAPTTRIDGLKIAGL